MDSDLLITLIFAGIALFVILKLRSVLGTRTGLEKKADPFPAPEPRESRENVVTLPDRRSEPLPSAEPRTPLEASLAAIRRADNSFHPDRFLEGAKMAFEMIVTAYAKGDEKTLEPLLAKDVYDSFASAIRQRRDAGQTMETSVVGIRSATIEGAEMRGREARITVNFVSEQVNLTKDKGGATVEGDPKAIETVTDVWTFGRDTRTRDPNWLLVETGAPETH
jgi:predicted lipid-binding transport protein (Tim44 family)